MNLDTEQARLQRGMKRAERVENIIRERAFLDLPEQINGVHVSQFTLRHRAILFQIKSPFIFGGKLCIEDIGAFMWIVSPHYDPQDPEKRAAFLAQLMMHPNGHMFSRAIDRYLDRAFMDAPPSFEGGKSVAASFTAGVVHKVAFAYGSGDGPRIFDQIMNTPIAALFQCQKWIEIERNFNTPQFNPLQTKLVQRFYDRLTHEVANGTENGQH